jgi:hypothetical protein
MMMINTGRIYNLRMLWCSAYYEFFSIEYTVFASPQNETCPKFESLYIYPGF